MADKGAGKPKEGKEKGSKEDNERAREKERMEAESRDLAVIASTFANNELESKRQTMQQYVDLASKLRMENTKLQEEMADRDKDSILVIEFLRKEVEKKQEKIEDLNRELETQRSDLNQQHQRERQDLENQLRDKTEQIAHTADELQRMEDELASVAQFKRDKHEMEATLKTLRENEVTLKEKYEKELSKLQFHSLEEKVRLKNEEKILQETHKHRVESEAYALLDDKVRKIHQQNADLTDYKNLLEKELEKVTSLKKTSEDKCDTKQRELELNQQNMHIAAKKGQRLGKELRELTFKNRDLETSLTKAIAAFEQDKAAQKKKYEAALRLRDSQLDEVYRLLDLRTKELQRIRGLAKQIVSERGELEAFFNEALEYVRRQIAEQNTTQQKLPPPAAPPGKDRNDTTPGRGRPSNKGGVGGKGAVVDSMKRKAIVGPPGSGGGGRANTSSSRGTDKDEEFGTSLQNAKFEPILEQSNDGQIRTPRDSLPPIQPSSGTPGQPPKIAKVDISDLTWADKERVLRILFAKINNVQPKRAPRPNKFQQSSGPAGYITDAGQKTFLTQPSQ
eukprot:TRINITY_DN57802_c0_g1_i1.p1 TRINITY_DN57802_c0_g1~~TRINITY_DN57802_c0_g1_i1.p1  ORF type:complete len:565 (-),score=90.52 TRINITY_DN57802_c0_g1_i1:157-1851(-)